MESRQALTVCDIIEPTSRSLCIAVYVGKNISQLGGRSLLILPIDHFHDHIIRPSQHEVDETLGEDIEVSEVISVLSHHIRSNHHWSNLSMVDHFLGVEGIPIFGSRYLF